MRYKGNSFPTIYKSSEEHKNNWITKRINVLCRNKRIIYIACKNTDDLQKKFILKIWYNLK